MPQRDHSRDHQYTQAENAHADLAYAALIAFSDPQPVDNMGTDHRP